MITTRFAEPQMETPEANLVPKEPQKEPLEANCTIQMINIKYQIQNAKYENKSLDAKCEVCGGTREALAIRRTPFDGVARSRVANRQPSYPPAGCPHR